MRAFTIVAMAFLFVFVGVQRCAHADELKAKSEEMKGEANAKAENAKGEVKALTEEAQGNTEGSQHQTTSQRLLGISCQLCYKPAELLS